MPLALTDVSGVGPSIAETLITNNIDSVRKLAEIDIKELTMVPGIGEITGKNMIQAARDLLAANPAEDKSAKKDRKKGGKNKQEKKAKKDKKGKKNKGKKNKK